MADRSDLPIAALLEHWRRQAQKLKEAGIPLERISDSIRVVALEVEQAWFEAILDGTSEYLATRPTTVRPEGDAEAEASFTPDAEDAPMSDRTVIEFDGKEDDRTYEVTGG
jgi:hypothetical protein